MKYMTSVRKIAFLAITFAVIAVSLLAMEAGAQSPVPLPSVAPAPTVRPIPTPMPRIVAPPGGQTPVPSAAPSTPQGPPNRPPQAPTGLPDVPAQLPPTPNPGIHGRGGAAVPSSAPAAVRRDQDIDAIQEFTPGMIQVMFRPGTGRAQHEAAISSAGAQLAMEPIGDLNIYDLKVSVGQEKAIARALRLNPQVQTTRVMAVPELRNVYPNDPNFDAFGAQSRSALQAAWEVRRPLQGTARIAVYDDGFEPHPEIASQIILRRNTCTNDASIYPDTGNYHHGTASAATAAGQAYNGIAGVGTYWGAPLILIQWNNVTTNQPCFSGNAFVFAADNGATVMSNSYGVPCDDIIRSQVQYAANRGVIIVAATDYQDRTLNPNDCPAGLGNRAVYGTTYGVIPVGRTRDNDHWELSEYGPDVVVARECNYVPWGPGINLYCGTSQVTPFVAGIAAMVREMGFYNSAAMGDLLRRTGDPIQNERYGGYSGRLVNAWTAITAAAYPTGIGSSNGAGILRLQRWTEKNQIDCPYTPPATDPWCYQLFTIGSLERYTNGDQIWQLSQGIRLDESRGTLFGSGWFPIDPINVTTASTNSVTGTRQQDGVVFHRWVYNGDEPCAWPDGSGGCVTWQTFNRGTSYSYFKLYVSRPDGSEYDVTGFGYIGS